jgi:glucose-6-phosphate isomerase
VSQAADVSAGGVSVGVQGASLVSARDRALEAARADDLAAQLAAKTATLWGAEATPEASIRLGWLDAPRVSHRAGRHGWLLACP